MSSNFLVFDPPLNNAISDAEYLLSTYRLNGAVAGIAPSAVHNKVFHQTSIMCAALANFMVSKGQNASDADLTALTAALTASLAQTNPFATGMGMDFDGTTPPDGWVFGYGTIGNASSNATNRANADTQDLFNLYWTYWSNTTAPIYTSAGVLSTRGASAAVDWAANKAISVKDVRGRARAGLDNMGGSAANVVPATLTSNNSITLGGVWGAATITLDATMVPALSGTTVSAGDHTHAITVDLGGTHTHTASSSTDGAHTHTFSYDANRGDSGSLGDGTNLTATGNTKTTSSAGNHNHTITVTSTNSAHSHTASSATAGAHTHTVTVNAVGGGNAHPNVQPTIFTNYIIKL